MKSGILLIILFLFAMAFPLGSIHAKTDISLTNRLKGKILLQIESKGEAWYLNPRDFKKYFLGNPEDAFKIMKEVGVGISNLDILKIPVAEANFSGNDTDGDGLSDVVEDALGTDKTMADTDNDGFPDKVELLNGYNPTKKIEKLPIDLNFISRQKGKIFIQTQRHGEAWYVNPGDGKRYFLGRPGDAFNVMRSLAVGITDANLAMVGYAEIIRRVGKSTTGTPQLLAKEEKIAPSVQPVEKKAETVVPAPETTTPLIQPVENKVEIVELKDCGEDEDCFLESAKECAPAKFKRSVNFVLYSGNQKEDSYYEIQGVKDGKCILYAKTAGLEIKYSESMKNKLLQQNHTQEELNKREADANKQQQSLVARYGVCKFDPEAYYYGARDVLVKIKQNFDKDMRPYTCSGSYFEPVRFKSVCTVYTGFRGMFQKGYHTDYKGFSFIDIDQSNNLTVEVDKIRDAIGYLETKVVNGLSIKNFGSKGGFITVEFNCN